MDAQNNSEKKPMPWWKQVLIVAIGVYLVCYSALVLALLATGQEITADLLGPMVPIVKLVVILVG